MGQQESPRAGPPETGVEGAEVAPGGRRMVWAGRVVGAIPVLVLLFSAAMKLARQPPVLEMWSGKFGYPDGTLFPIAVAELACALLYAIPRTAVLGAVLLSGYLGGAIATHVRVADSFTAPLVFAVLAWAGLYLRDSRLRALLPLRRTG